MMNEQKSSIMIKNYYFSFQVNQNTLKYPIIIDKPQISYYFQTLANLLVFKKNPHNTW